MIQRIQSLYLLGASFLGFSGFFLLAEEYFLIFLCVLGGILSVVSMLFYSNRKKQLLFNRINLLIQIIILGVLAWQRLNSSGGGFELSKKGVWFLLPVVSIVFLLLASRAIFKDEELVKSADRLR